MLDQNDIKQIGTLLQGTEQKLTTLVEKTEGKLTKFVREELEENNKKLTKEIVGQVVVEVWEFITDNVLTQIDGLSSDLTKVKDDLTEVKNDLVEVKKTVTTLATKDDVTRAVADVKGEFAALVRKEDEKVDLHVKFSHENKALTEQQWKALKELQVFPAIEIS